MVNINPPPPLPRHAFDALLLIKLYGTPRGDI